MTRLKSSLPVEQAGPQLAVFGERGARVGQEWLDGFEGQRVFKNMHVHLAEKLLIDAKISVL